MVMVHFSAMPNLANLHPFPEDGPIVMVVESPRGSTVKLRYDTKAEIFIVARALPTGTTYPFDWGFIPGTRGEDGDPLDAMALHDAATYPGVVLPCRVLGMVEVTQNGKTGRESNPRYLVGMIEWVSWQRLRGCPRACAMRLSNSFSIQHSSPAKTLVSNRGMVVASRKRFCAGMLSERTDWP
jgi:hypothetical protein